MACQDMVQERLGLGSLAVLSSKIWRSTLHLHVKEIVRVRNEVANCVVELQDHKGGSPAEWPADLRVREMPASSEFKGDKRA